MFEKYRTKRNRFLPVLSAVMEVQEFNRSLAERGLKEICAALGDNMELVVSVSVKDMESYIFSTLPEDEARYYLIRTWEPNVEKRAEGRKALEFDLYVKGILFGIGVLEVPEQTGEEEISEYKEMFPVLKTFLYCCFLTELCEEEQGRDCFTGLPGDSYFKKDLKAAVAGESKGYFLAVRVYTDTKSAGGLNGAVKKAAICCKSIRSGKAYRIGPEVLAVLYYGEKPDAMAAAQELMYELPDCSVLLEPLDGLGADAVSERIGKWCTARRNGVSVPRDEGVYPRLPVFDEVAL